MFQLWAVRVDGGDGKERYGEDYADVYAINRVHFKAAANGSCDHVSQRSRCSRCLSRLRVYDIMIPFFR